MILYEVEAVLGDTTTAAQWVRWMVTEHLAAVTSAGAASARLVRLDGEGVRYRAQYTFASRAAFERYLAEEAPRLRAEGLSRFPADAVRYLRTAGEIVTELPVGSAPGC